MTMTGRNEKALLDAVLSATRVKNGKPGHPNGNGHGGRNDSKRTAPADFADVVTHIFHKAKRKALGVAD
jgi:hypothetical protein